MTSFASTSFSTASFSVQAFDFGNLVSESPSPIGYMSGSYVTRMSETEFERRRKIFRHDLENTVFRMFAEKEMPELHAELTAVTLDVTVEQKRRREMRISEIIDRQILAAHETEVRRMVAEDDDEALMIAYLLN